MKSPVSPFLEHAATFYLHVSAPGGPDMALQKRARRDAPAPRWPFWQGLQWPSLGLCREGPPGLGTGAALTLGPLHLKSTAPHQE